MISSWLDRFFEAHYAANPVEASFAGETDWDHHLPDCSAAGLEAQATRCQSLLEESRAFEPIRGIADASDRIDVRLAQGALRIRLWELRSTHFERGNPSTYTGEAAFSLISLFLRSHTPLEVRLDAATQRLEGFARFFEDARANVVQEPLPWTERAIRECDGILALLRDGVPLIEEGRALRSKRFVEAAHRAELEVNVHRNHLAATQVDATRATTEAVSAGAEALELLIREGHGLASSADEIVRDAEEGLREATARLREGAAEFGVSTPTDALALLGKSHPTRETYLNSYETCWREARDVAVKNELVTWPEFPIRYVERPQWARSAAPFLYFLFYRSPPIKNPAPIYEYLVSPLDPSGSAAATTAFLEAHNHSMIKSNHVIHHGGLGHHVQNFYAARASSRVGRMAAIDGASRIALLCGGTLAEGWACYATDLMREMGFMTPLERYGEWHARARMCSRAIVDVRLHRGRLTLEEAAHFYEENALMSPQAARNEATKNSMFPATGLMYFVGCEGIHALRRAVSKREGSSFSLKAFHDRLLSHGSIPVSLIAEQFSC